MAQEVAILSGIGDAPAGLDGMQAVIKLQGAQTNILNLWARAWDLKRTAHDLAVRAVQGQDAKLYEAAKADNAEADRWMRRAAEQMRENDTLRGQLYGQVHGSVQLTQAAADWFGKPAGLPVPPKYLKAAGGTPIPRFPEFA